MATDTADLAAALSEGVESGNHRAWECVINETRPAIGATISRVFSRCGVSSEHRDDLIQETFLKICSSDFAVLRKLRKASREAILAYFRTVASSVAHDYLRAQIAQKRGSGREIQDLAGLPFEPAAHDDSFQTIERSLLIDHINRCLAAHAERDRWLFWMYYRQGFTSKALSGFSHLKLTQKGIEAALYRVTVSVRDCVQKVQSTPAANKKEDTD